MSKAKTASSSLNKEPEYLIETCMTPWKYDDGDCDDCEECNRCRMYREDNDKREGRKK